MGISPSNVDAKMTNSQGSNNDDDDDDDDGWMTSRLMEETTEITTTVRRTRKISWRTRWKIGGDLLILMTLLDFVRDLFVNQRRRIVWHEVETPRTNRSRRTTVWRLPLENNDGRGHRVQSRTHRSKHGHLSKTKGLDEFEDTRTLLQSMNRKWREEREEQLRRLQQKKKRMYDDDAALEDYDDDDDDDDVFDDGGDVDHPDDDSSSNSRRCCQERMGRTCS